MLQPGLYFSSGSEAAVAYCVCLGWPHRLRCSNSNEMWFCVGEGFNRLRPEERNIWIMLSFAHNVNFDIDLSSRSLGPVVALLPFKYDIQCFSRNIWFKWHCKHYWGKCFQICHIHLCSSRNENDQIFTVVELGRRQTVFSGTFLHWSMALLVNVRWLMMGISSIPH